ncbi:LysE family translocator [Kitasatospora kifunensis]|uniref:Threonine/homoserine/homoserine lactone efflux protein n=1 Tax=Kitasatospora kifunensis TaxID=58351 RepID=A0A7W7QWU8_KITKI|nr:LysE family translocator [Kitasatospora kifunensis]MBB4921204.1 threonine/homoserine/homoserine lactone efflux protein [Kitasatospora kifunensis]
MTLPSLAALALFVPTVMALVAVPGPNMLLILSRGIGQGRRAAFASAVGVELGTLVHVLGTVIGVSALIATSALAFGLVKYAGAAYLVYLGVRTLVTKSAGLAPGAPHAGAAGPQPVRTLLRQGALVNVLNPKVALFFLALLPQYVNPDRGSVASQTLVLGMVFFAIALAMDLLYALASVGVGAWLARSARFARAQKYITGCTYLVLGVSAAFAQPSGGHRRG